MHLCKKKRIKTVHSQLAVDLTIWIVIYNIKKRLTEKSNSFSRITMLCCKNDTTTHLTLKRWQNLSQLLSMSIVDLSKFYIYSTLSTKRTSIMSKRWMNTKRLDTTSVEPFLYKVCCFYVKANTKHSANAWFSNFTDRLRLQGIKIP